MEHFFGKNLKYIRELKGLSQNKLSEKINVSQTTIARWEDENRIPIIDNAIDVANALNIELPDLLFKDLQFDNAELIELPTETVKIPVLGYIKAGIPIEAQEDIIEYIEIPKKWTIGNKKFYGLRISGNSMYPKYEEQNTVIFEQTNDYEKANNKDCAVMLNCTECTFKKVYLNESGIILQAYNNEYPPMNFTKEQIAELPVTIVGIAVEKRVKL